MVKYHWFNFSWGYVESARIACLPNWYHAEGFDTAAEAAESFARALMSLVRTYGCPEHSSQSGNFCAICGKPLQRIQGSYEEALEYFDDLYRADNDRCPSGDDWDNGWHADWEVQRHPDDRVLTIHRFNYFLSGEGDPSYLAIER